MHSDPPQEPQERRTNPILQLELPSALPTAIAPNVAPVVSEVRPTPSRKRSWALGTAFGVLAIAGTAALVTSLPGYVRRRCIEEAAAHGIALTIDDVRISGSGFVLMGVKATTAALPDASVEAPQLAVETHGLKPEKLTATGMRIVVSGRWSDVGAALARWRESAQGGQGGAWAPASFVIDGSRIVWRDPIEEQASLEAAGVHLDVTWNGDATIHGTSSEVTVRVPAGTLGPWRVDLDREPGTSRTRIALDPSVPETSTVLFVANDEAVVAVDVAIPRSPLARLGLPPALFDLGRDAQLQASLHYAPFGAQARAIARTQGGLYGVKIEGVSRPLDIAWDVTGTGPTTDIDVKDAKVAVGPLVGAARGTLKGYGDGFRLDVAWSAGPVPCAAFETPLGLGQPFDIAYKLRELAELAKNAGPSQRREMSANATLVFDSRDFGANALTFQSKASCSAGPTSDNR